MLVTPLRDGMNLIAKEYVAAGRRTGERWFLSEDDRRSQRALGEEAILVNPNDITRKWPAPSATAMEMPVEESEAEVMTAMWTGCDATTSSRWAGSDILEALKEDRSHAWTGRMPSRGCAQRIVSEFQSAGRAPAAAGLRRYDGAPYPRHRSRPATPYACAAGDFGSQLAGIADVVIVSGKPSPHPDAQAVDASTCAMQCWRTGAGAQRAGELKARDEVLLRRLEARGPLTPMLGCALSDWLPRRGSRKNGDRPAPIAKAEPDLRAAKCRAERPLDRPDPGDKRAAGHAGTRS